MKQIYILFALLFVFNGCEKDEITHSNIQQGDLLSIQKQFSLADFKDEFIKDNLKIDWSGVQETNQDETAFEFTTNLNSSLQNEQNSLFYKYQLIAYRNNDDWEFELAKFTAFDAANLEASTIANMENFTGTLSKFNLYGEMIEISAYEDGEIISTPEKDKSTDNYKYEPPIAPGPCTGCNWVMIFTERWMDYYAIGSEGSEYLGSFLISRTNEWVYVPNSGEYNTGFGDYAGGDLYHDHYEDGPHGPAQTSENHPVEILIDPSFENTKADCVYDKLNYSSTSFKEAIKKFDGEFPVAHLKFSMADLADNTRGRTLPPENYINEIQLNNDQSNSGVSYRPNLLTAKTIMHEVIHAEMWRKILSIIDNGGDVGGMTRQEWTNKLSNGDYPGIFDYYSRYGINEFQHPQIATHYRDVIAHALQEFDNNAHSRQFYMDLAWEGLRYSNISAWADLPQWEKDRINNVISTYISNNSNQSCE